MKMSKRYRYAITWQDGIVHYVEGTTLQEALKPKADNPNDEWARIIKVEYLGEVYPPVDVFSELQKLYSLKVAHAVKDNARAMAEAGHKIAAIKLIRSMVSAIDESSRVGLKEAKDYVESLL